MPSGLEWRLLGMAALIFRAYLVCIISVCSASHRLKMYMA